MKTDPTLMWLIVKENLILFAVKASNVLGGVHIACNDKLC
jgi:hypothetical protein